MSAVQQLEVPVAPVLRRHLRALPDVQQSASRVSKVRMARRRFAALLVLLVVVGGAFLAGRAFASDENGASGVVTVRAGDTLSGLAARAYPNMSMDAAVAKLQQVNNLGSSHIDAGQVLSVPR